ncbi:MAG: hypothetical protein R3C01_10350 [Planctomycetaceae bacterium]
MRRRHFLGLSASFIASVATVARGEDLLPKHVTPETVKSIGRALDWLAQAQAQDGSYRNSDDGRTYPTAMAALAGMAFLANGNTSTRGPFADQVRKVTKYLISQTHGNGLISEGQESGHPMYGHGFSLLFLSSAYGGETVPAIRKKMHEVIKNGIHLTAAGQSNLGGWTYYPGGGDEGSVTVTQMQGLRAAHEAGFTIPKGTIEKGIRYLEICRTSKGGICYSYGSGDDTRLPITAAAICCLYSAGEYESPLAESCLKFVIGEFRTSGKNFRSGHDFYTNIYAAQAFYQAGDEYWDSYFPPTRDRLIKDQDKDGHWDGDGVGPVFGTALASIILQLPYKYLPIYQR